MSEVSPDSNGGAESNGGAGGLQWTIESGPRPKPWQLSACVMLANGASHASVARTHGVDTNTVTNLLRQKWAAERIEQLTTENHKSIADAFKAERLASLATLISLRDGAMSEAVRASCALAIIERTMGKPGVQVPEASPPFNGDPVEEYHRIQVELDRGYEERRRFDPPKGGGQASE